MCMYFYSTQPQFYCFTVSEMYANCLLKRGKPRYITNIMQQKQYRNKTTFELFYIACLKPNPSLRRTKRDQKMRGQGHLRSQGHLRGQGSHHRQGQSLHHPLRKGRYFCHTNPQSTKITENKIYVSKITRQNSFTLYQEFRD